MIAFYTMEVMKIIMYLQNTNKLIYMILQVLQFRHWQGPGILCLEICTWKLNHWQIMDIVFGMLLMIQ